jgi:hypothetical protein
MDDLEIIRFVAMDVITNPAYHAFSQKKRPFCRAVPSGLTMGCGRLQEDIQVVRMNGAKLRVLFFDFAVPNQRHKRFFQSERAPFLGKRDLLMEVLQIVSANVMPRAISNHQ